MHGIQNRLKNKKFRFNLGILAYAGLGSGLVIIDYLIFHLNLYAGLLFAALPFIAIITIGIIKYPVYLYLFIFSLSYFIMGLDRYWRSLEPGVVITFLLFILLGTLLIRSIRSSLNWNTLRNAPTLFVGFWLLYCILEVFNLQMGSVLSWMLSLRGIALYFFFFFCFTLLLFHRYRDLKRFLFFWSVFTLLAVLKAFIQKEFGFDYAEKYWLWVDGGARTHVIYSGIRYFSFFTDAANFGCSMAFSAVVFSISAFFIRKNRLKIYYLVVALAALYAMLISGTRAVILIPFTGYVAFIALTKNKRLIALGILLVTAAFCFFYFTNYGQGNAYIRRMRTAFHPSKDASFQVRMENQERFYRMLKGKPFGMGVGSANPSQNVKASVITIPTDSWLVKVWVQTGILGLCLYLGILIYLIIRGAYFVFFKVKDKELRGLLIALICGVSGMLAASYANDILAPFPNGPIVYMALAFISLAPKLDREIGKKTIQHHKNEPLA